MQVLRYHGPRAEKPGTFDRCILELEEDTGNPWDVRVCREQLIVTVHKGAKEKEHARVLVLDAETGAQLKCIRSKLLDQPNMIALE